MNEVPLRIPHREEDTVPGDALNGHVGNEREEGMLGYAAAELWESKQRVKRDSVFFSSL